MFRCVVGRKPRDFVGADNTQLAPALVVGLGDYTDGGFGYAKHGTVHHMPTKSRLTLFSFSDDHWVSRFALGGTRLQAEQNHTHVFFVFVLKTHVPVTLIKSLSVRVGGTSVARLRACFLFAQGRVDRAA